MNALIKYLIENITGNSEFEIEEKEENSLVTYIIQAKPEFMGLIIGKAGKTIKTIRNLVKVRATLEKKSVNLTVEELI